MPDVPSLRNLLDVVAELGWSDGVSLRAVARSLAVNEPQVAGVWKRAQAEGLITPAGGDPASGGQLWRLTGKGWSARNQPPERS